MIVSSLVAVDAVLSMGDVVGASGRPWGASLGDDSWELGGVAGRLVERMDEMAMQFKRVVVGLANSTCAFCANDFDGSVGGDDGGVRTDG